MTNKKEKKETKDKKEKEKKDKKEKEEEKENGSNNIPASILEIIHIRSDEIDFNIGKTRHDVDVKKFPYDTNKDNYVESYKTTTSHGKEYLKNLRQISNVLIPGTQSEIEKNENGEIIRVFMYVPSKGISVYEYLLKKNPFTEQLYDNIINAIEACHEKGITHGDITFGNIVIDYKNSDHGRGQLTSEKET